MLCKMSMHFFLTEGTETIFFYLVYLSKTVEKFGIFQQGTFDANYQSFTKIHS